MERLKTWLIRGALALGGLVVVLFLMAGGWWLTRPAAPPPATMVEEEHLADPAYRPSADSALAMIRSAAAELGLPSVSVAVSVDGAVVWAAALGTVDLSEERPASLGTQYRAGSVSKSMTGVAAAELVEAGTLVLDSPVSAYVPAFPSKRWDPTVRQLGAHTGGVRHYHRPGEGAFLREQFSKRHHGSVEEALDLFAADSLLFEPGTDFQYSTHGFTLLAAALEGAAGEPYLDIMASRVWEPLGMTSTGPDDFTVERPDRAVPYSVVAGGRVTRTEGADPSYKWAGGGILTTPTDLVRLGGALLTGGVVGDSLFADLLTPRALDDGSANPQRYALGWRNGMAELDGDTVPTLHHGGSSPGGSSFVILLPASEGRSRDVAAAAMTNLTVGNPTALRTAVTRLAGLFSRSGP